MDLESEGSVLDSVDDNSVIQQGENAAYEGNVLTNGPCLDERDTRVSSPGEAADKEEKMIYKSNDFDSSAKSSPKKGYGLRKWRRIRRDEVKDMQAYTSNNNIYLKRVLSDATDLEAKQMHSPSPEEVTKTFGDSMNLEKNTVMADSSVVSGSSPDTRMASGFAFMAGVDSENNEDQSSKSSTAASVAKNKQWDMKNSDVRGRQGKSGAEQRLKKVKIDKENSHSRRESDSRSSNLVYMQSDFCNSEGASQGDTASGGLVDPLTESMSSFLILQEALEKEVQRFQEMGKEPMELLHRADSSCSIRSIGEHYSEQSSSNRFETGETGHKKTTSSDSLISSMMKNIEYMEIDLEATRSALEVKESRIHVLESTINLGQFSGKEIETWVEDAFKQKVEAEIEYLITQRSLDRLKMMLGNQMKMFEEEKAMVGEEAQNALGKLEQAKNKASILNNRAVELEKRCGYIIETREVESFKKRAGKTISCFLTQLVLMLVVVWLFICQRLPRSEIVVPT